MQEENIRNYDLETEIGHEVDGYELVALFAKRDILTNQYNPTAPERFVNDWAFTQYDLPNDVGQINQRISEIVGSGNIHLAEQLVDSINIMTNHGNVGPEIHKLDNQYWNLVAGKIMCSENSNCDMSWLDQDQNGLALIQQVGSYVNHWSTITLTFEPCEASVPTCTAAKDNNGSGYDSVLVSPTYIHITDSYVQADMSAWGQYGSTVFVMGQVTASLQGSAQYQSGATYVSTTKYLTNPNYVVQSQPTITFTSYAWVA